MLSAHLSREREGSTEGGGLPFINCIILSFQADKYLRQPKGGDFQVPPPAFPFPPPFPKEVLCQNIPVATPGILKRSQNQRISGNLLKFNPIFSGRKTCYVYNLSCYTPSPL